MSNLVAQAWAQSNFASEYAARVKGVAAYNALITAHNNQIDALYAIPEFKAIVASTSPAIEEAKVELKALHEERMKDGVDLDLEIRNCEKKVFRAEVQLVESIAINLSTAEKLALRNAGEDISKVNLIDISEYVGKEEDAANLTKKINDQFSNKKKGFSKDFQTTESFKRATPIKDYSMSNHLKYADILNRGFGLNIDSQNKKQFNTESLVREIHWCQTPSRFGSKSAFYGINELDFIQWIEYALGNDLMPLQDLEDHGIDITGIFDVYETYFVACNNKINDVVSERLENFNFYTRMIEAARIDYKNGDATFACSKSVADAFSSLVEECEIDYEFAPVEEEDYVPEETAVISEQAIVISESTKASVVLTPSNTPINELLEYEASLCSKFNLDPARVLEVCNIDEYRVARREQYLKLEETNKHFQMLTDTVFQTGELSEEELLAMVDTASDEFDLFFVNLINEIDAQLKEVVPSQELEVKSEVAETIVESPKALPLVVDKTRVLTRISNVLALRKDRLQVNDQKGKGESENRELRVAA